MITSVNPFLIEKQDGTDIENSVPGKWLFKVKKNGFLKASFLQMDADLDIQVILEETGAVCEINCGYLSNNNNKININIHVTHKSKETHSFQKIKGLATGNSEAHFNGIITIPYDSQKCEGTQNHRGIILSDKAKIAATPELEIWADDVKCSHGSAIGPLSKEQLFYLQTRGLTLSEARKILLSSFFGDLMPSEFNAVIQDWMDKNV